MNLSAERHYGEAVRKYLTAGLFTAVHDISDGGMLVALAEMAVASDVGATICLLTRDDTVGRSERCFGEGQGSYLATVSPDVFDGNRFDGCEDIYEFLNHYHDIGLTSEVIGTTGGAEIVVNEVVSWQGGVRHEAELARIPLADLRAVHEGFFPKLMGADAALA